MKKNYLKSIRSGAFGSLILTIFISANSYSQAPAIQWDKTFGGTAADALYSIQPTSDGGYILGGYSGSGISGNKSQALKGAPNDYWVVKIDANGTKQWDKTFGGSSLDQLFAAYQTADGGYILGGYSNSGLNGDKSHANKGFYDYWIVKLNPDGIKVWDNNFGTTGFIINEFHDLRQTADGGYILGGTSDGTMSGDKSENSKGSTDFWIIKINPDGNKVWDKTIGGSGEDAFSSLVLASDGGYILGGTSNSPVSGDKTEASKGTRDYWIVKLNADGVKVWDKTIGSSASETLTDLEATSDGGYIIGGSTPDAPVSGDKTEASKGDQDFWIVKTDVNGTKIWDKSIGGTGPDMLYSIKQTKDGNYLAGGSSPSKISGDKTETNFGVNDYWIAMLDGTGQKLWTKTIGGNNTSVLTSVALGGDGGYLIGGRTNSGKLNNKSEENMQLNGFTDDYWVVKVAGPTITGYENSENQKEGISLYPNPANVTKGFSLLLNGINSNALSAVVYNSLGQEIENRSVKLTNGIQTENFNTENLKEGLYTVMITYGQTKIIKKIILQ